MQPQREVYGVGGAKIIPPGGAGRLFLLALERKDRQRENEHTASPRAPHGAVRGPHRRGHSAVCISPSIKKMLGNTRGRRV